MCASLSVASYARLNTVKQLLLGDSPETRATMTTTGSSQNKPDEHRTIKET
jgi:hypothetical protein